MALRSLAARAAAYGAVIATLQTSFESDFFLSDGGFACPAAGSNADSQWQVSDIEPANAGNS